jgi:uroporphyrinogen decarboxylase
MRNELRKKEDALVVKIPVRVQELDAKKAIDHLMGRTLLDHPPLVEYIIDEAILRPVLAAMGREWVDSGVNLCGWLDNFAAFYYRMGYSLVKFELALPFESRHLLAPDTAPYVQRDRSWTDEHHGMITSWADFERYPWPKVEDYDFAPAGWDGVDAFARGRSVREAFRPDVIRRFMPCAV